MSTYVEVWGRSGRELRVLDSERMTVGTLESNDVVVDADGVSRVHAVFERFGPPGASATSAHATAPS